MRVIIGRVSKLGRVGFTAAAAVLAVTAIGVGPATQASAVAPHATAPNWFGPTSGRAADQLVQYLSTARADNLNPKRYNVRGLQRAISAASRGDPAAIQRANAQLNQALVQYVRDLKHDPNIGIIYVDQEVRPTPPSPQTILAQAASAPSLSDYVGKMGWMNPIYARLRQALAGGQYLNDAQRRLLAVNLERARVLPSGGRYVIVNSPAARLYMYENGELVDSMRVVAGRSDPIAQTPMMSGLIRYTALNPYWNAPPDIAAKRLAPNVLKRGNAYLKEKGYEILSDWSDNARVVDWKTVDWNGVVAGRVHVRMRQKPGPANSMGRMKFMFPNEQGIWLHDTPEREKLEEAARQQSNGCVRLEDAPRFARWLYGRPLKAQGARPEQKVPLARPVPIYLTYLTAVPSGSSIVYFDDFYGIDRAARVRRA